MEAQEVQKIISRAHEALDAMRAAKREFDHLLDSLSEPKCPSKIENPQEYIDYLNASQEYTRKISEAKEKLKPARRELAKATKEWAESLPSDIWFRDGDIGIMLTERGFYTKSWKEIEME